MALNIAERNVSVRVLRTEKMNLFLGERGFIAARAVVAPNCPIEIHDVVYAPADELDHHEIISVTRLTSTRCSLCGFMSQCPVQNMVKPEAAAD